MVDAFLKGGVNNFKVLEFSGYFKNIKELQSFLRFAKYFTGGSITLDLGIAFKSWKPINKKEVVMIKTTDEIIARMKVIREIVEIDRKKAHDYSLGEYNPTKGHDYFGEYYGLQTDLRILDPNNHELQIGIHGKPFGAGLKD